MRRRHGGAGGNRRRSCTGIIKCHLGCFWAAWHCWHVFLETGYCTGMGASGENSDESSFAARDCRVFLRGHRIPGGIVLCATATQKHRGRERPSGRNNGFDRNSAAESVQHGDPAAETTEARVTSTVAGRTAP